MTEREDHEVPSAGDALAAWLYRPRGRASGCCVVLANGFSLTREHTLPRFAEAFAEAGHHALVFDYRYFGASGGQPRQTVHPYRQREDYDAALRYAADLPGVRDLVLWGYSYGGGSALHRAAHHRDRIAAALLTAPMITTMGSARMQPARNLLGLFTSSVRDVVGARLGRPPVTVPMASAHGFGVAHGPETLHGFQSLAADRPWRNEINARFGLQNLTNRPSAGIRRLTAPTLFAIAEQDALVPPRLIARAAARAPRGQIRRYPADHFDVLLQDELIADQVDFLDRVLS